MQWAMGCCLVGVEGGSHEMENHQWATILVKIDQGEGHPWMLNLGGSFDNEQDTFMVSKCFPRDF